MEDKSQYSGPAKQIDDIESSADHRWYPNYHHPIILSTVGLVYREFGKEIIEKVASKANIVLGYNREEIDSNVNHIFHRFYNAFIKELDAGDNGINILPFEDDTIYRMNTCEWINVD